jgi:hypothetical protein
MRPYESRFFFLFYAHFFVNVKKLMKVITWLISKPFFIASDTIRSSSTFFLLFLDITAGGTRRPMCYDLVHIGYVNTLMHFETVHLFYVVLNKFTMNDIEYNMK